MEINLVGYVMIGMILIVCIKMYLDSDYWNLKCIISDVDGKRYCVRERGKLELAADKLAKTTEGMQKLVDHCAKKYLIEIM